MKRRIVGIALFCLVLLAAIFAGYWDMLNTEKMRIARERAAPNSGEIAALVDPKPAPGGVAGDAPAPAVDPAPAPAPARAPASVSAADPGQTPATGPAASAETTSALPTFDVLRVEPDGSTVMAGKAAAGTTVRLTDGTTVLGEEKAGPGGEFAIVLDKPLPVGEHQIRIEATGADGAAATSRETAIVSVPQRGREDELLALVETPDQPSRLISVPMGGPQPQGTAGDAAPEAATGAPSSEAVSEPTTQPDTATGAPRMDAAPQGRTDAPSANNAPETANSTPSAPETDIGAAAPSGTAAPAPADAVSPPADSPPPAPQPSGAAEDAARSTPAPEVGDTAVPSPGRSSNLVLESELAVEAVEIEDETIYVAGRAPVGPTIRIYVDNVFLAEDAGRKTDRFLVTTKSAVTPGEHMVRADQIARDGSVVARVEVPFLKPEGRSMSAVADASTAAPDSGANGAPSTGTAPASPSGGQDGSSGTSGHATASAATGETPPPATPAAGEQASSLPGRSEPPPPGGVGSPPADVMTAAPAAAPSPAPAPAASQTAAGAGVAVPDTLQGPKAAANDGSAPGSDIAAARQAPLQAAGARVIIRRGDTLWRISRETYGRGARYTTIYLANGDQIRNPNRIYPGQVFRMPEHADD